MPQKGRGDGARGNAFVKGMKRRNSTRQPVKPVKSRGVRDENPSYPATQPRAETAGEDPARYAV